jgi:hypothetical protein
MDLMRILQELGHLIKVLFGQIPKERVEVLQEAAKPVRTDFDQGVAPEVRKAVEEAKKEISKEIESSKPELSKPERIRRILRLITERMERQGNGSEVFELNPIHPEFAPYIVSSGTAYASEKTEAKLHGLKDMTFKMAYVYEALSAQWRREFRYLIEEQGKRVGVGAGRTGSKIRADLHELWRQTVWTDKRISEAFLKDNKITDAELEEFLLALAEDEVEAYLKTDKSRVN